MNCETLNFDVIVVGTGAAGFNAANRVAEAGRKSVAIVTEGINCGTSRNTGSDKQTYYKLTLGGGNDDNVESMAQNLFAGGCVDGDNAYCEAALSARSFLNLCELGVKFPRNEYGEYVGYQTDHDAHLRATSAGPLTSKFMTEALQARARELGIEIIDNTYVTDILTEGNRAVGLVGINHNGDVSKNDDFGKEGDNRKNDDFGNEGDVSKNDDFGNEGDVSKNDDVGNEGDRTIADAKIITIKAPNIVLATGGPAGIYADSVYPVSQNGSTSLALLAGAKLQNMTEWQFGLSSVAPRWNVSGSYMQVLPRFVAVDDAGKEYEFLLDYFEDKYEALDKVFLKGYQWPFDCKKVVGGSSIIDLLVYRQTAILGRRVYLDYTRNPFELEEIDYSQLSAETRNYLEDTGAIAPTPIERLKIMNTPAVEFYASRGVDLTCDGLQIALCAQHNNGGIAVDGWWETCVKGLFAVGECAGTHGVSRPGGSALNAGQVGSFRAAEKINLGGCGDSDSQSGDLQACGDSDSHGGDLQGRGDSDSHGGDLQGCGDSDSQSGDLQGRGDSHSPEFDKLVAEKIADLKKLYDSTKYRGEYGRFAPGELLLEIRQTMSDNASAIRDVEKIAGVMEELRERLKNLSNLVAIRSLKDMIKIFRVRDALVTSIAVCSAMIDYAQTVGFSRGSAIYHDAEGTQIDGLEQMFAFSEPQDGWTDKIQEIFWFDNDANTQWRDVRPLPKPEQNFERAWAAYLKREEGCDNYE